MKYDRERIIAPTPLNLKDSKDGRASIINITLPSEQLIKRTQEEEKE
jgi:hypothetical protein